ncbi:hypothetical protein HK098_003581 [Nowakowskiella sp. JEL0407]|nr:hypothetical protein HK098_003581 [Nowakowskiella sp. JEL0407]
MSFLFKRNIKIRTESAISKKLLNELLNEKYWPDEVVVTNEVEISRLIPVDGKRKAEEGILDIEIVLRLNIEYEEVDLIAEQPKFSSRRGVKIYGSLPGMKYEEQSSGESLFSFFYPKSGYAGVSVGLKEEKKSETSSTDGEHEINDSLSKPVFKVEIDNANSEALKNEERKLICDQEVRSGDIANSARPDEEKVALLETTATTIVKKGGIEGESKKSVKSVVITPKYTETGGKGINPIHQVIKVSNVSSDKSFFNKGVGAKKMTAIQRERLARFEELLDKGNESKESTSSKEDVAVHYPMMAAMTFSSTSPKLLNSSSIADMVGVSKHTSLTVESVAKPDAVPQPQNDTILQKYEPKIPLNDGEINWAQVVQDRKTKESKRILTCGSKQPLTLKLQRQSATQSQIQAKGRTLFKDTGTQAATKTQIPTDNDRTIKGNHNDSPNKNPSSFKQGLPYSLVPTVQNFKFKFKEFEILSIVQEEKKDAFSNKESLYPMMAGIKASKPSPLNNNKVEKSGVAVPKSKLKQNKTQSFPSPDVDFAIPKVEDLSNGKPLRKSDTSDDEMIPKEVVKKLQSPSTEIAKETDNVLEKRSVEPTKQKNAGSIGESSVECNWASTWKQSRKSGVKMHPLTPLSAEEIAQTVAILKAAPSTASSYDVSLATRVADTSTIFNTITLLEPAKKTIVAYDAAVYEGTTPEPVPRVSLATILLADGTLVEAEVDLGLNQVVKMKDLGKGLQPTLTPDDCLEVERIAIEDERVLSECAKCGFTDRTLIICDPWSIGYARMYEDDNQYAHPLDFVPIVDLISKKVIKIEYLPERTSNTPVPVQKKSHNYMEKFQESLCTLLKPLEITQPSGPSFSVTENEISWHKFKFRIGFNYREGLVL